MTASKTRAEFKAWVCSRECNLIPAGQQWDGIRCEVAWEAWQAARRATLEEAAQVCDDVRDGGDSFKKYEDNHDDGHMDGCNNCVAAIRALGDEGMKL